MQDHSLIPPIMLRRLVRYGAMLPCALGIVMWMVLGNLPMLLLCVAVLVAFGLADSWAGRNPEQATMAIAWFSFAVTLSLLPLYGGLKGPMMIVLVSPVLLATTCRRRGHGHVMLAVSVLAVVGAYVLARVQAHAPSDGTDELFATVLVVILVTAQQFAQQSIRRQRDMADRALRQEQRALAALAERNDELARRQEMEGDLQLALQQAEEASRAKSAFLASMSHELRTPLNAIIGYAEMLSEDVADLEHRTDLDRIERSGRHLLTLINDVLDLSKVEAGRMELHPEAFDLDALLEDIVGEVRPLVAAQRNRFSVRDEATERALVVDRVRTRQVLLNLLSNAAKFTREGDVELTVRSEVRNRQDVVVFEVRDTGAGIALEHLARLFRPFVQVDSQPSCREGGTGLGLVLSRSFAERMDGSVDMVSEPGVGSTFTFVVPRRAPEAVVDAWMARRVEDARSSAASVALCVGWTASELELLDRRLEHEGLLAVPVRQGSRALELIREMVPALVLLDMHGVGYDARELLGQIRSDERLEGVAVLLCRSDSATTIPALPRVAALSKPVEASALRGMIQLLVYGVRPSLRAG